MSRCPSLKDDVEWFGKDLAYTAESIPRVTRRPTLASLIDGENTRLMLLNDSAADVFGNRSLLGLIRSAFARGLGESDFERSGAAGLLCPRGRKKARDYYTPTAIHAALQRGLIPFCQTMFPVISHIFISFLSFYLHCFILFIIPFFLWWFINLAFKLPRVSQTDTGDNLCICHCLCVPV